MLILTAGNFREDLTDDVSRLTPEQLQSLVVWRDFYHKVCYTPQQGNTGTLDHAPDLYSWQASTKHPGPGLASGSAQTDLQLYSSPPVTCKDAYPFTLELVATTTWMSCSKAQVQ